MALAAYSIHRPSGDTVLLYDSPHSGRCYPPSWATGAPLAELRRGEDAYVDELLMPSVEDGAALLVNNYPRCYIDVNRAATDVDPAQLADEWPEKLEPTEKSRRGLGLIRRYVVPGVEAQAGPITAADLRARLDDVYRPYHAALDALVDELRTARQPVWHVDWHSMKSAGNAMTPDGAGGRRSDFVVSDVRGTAADPALTELIAGTLRGLGYSVSINDPYTGGTIVQRLGAPSRGVHSVQVEINRALYLDERMVEKHAGFERLAAHLRAFTRRLVDDYGRGR